MSKPVVDGLFAKRHPRIAAKIQAEYAVIRSGNKRDTLIKFNECCKLLGVAEHHLETICREDGIKIYRRRYVDEDGFVKQTGKYILAKNIDLIRAGIKRREKPENFVTINEFLELRKEKGEYYDIKDARRIIRSLKDSTIVRLCTIDTPRGRIYIWCVEPEKFKEVFDNVIKSRKSRSRRGAR